MPELAPRFGASSLESDSLGRALKQVLSVLVGAVIPAALLTIFLASPAHGFDFQPFWQAGHDVLAGRSPYVPADQADFVHAIAVMSDGENAFGFVYPMPAALFMAPFALLPYGVAAGLFIGILVAAVLLTLRILGVRDWRCYGVVFLWLSTLKGVQFGTLTPLLVLGVAALWCYRDKRRVAAPLLAAIVIAKLFLWPLAVWFLATRRASTAILAAALGVVATLASWGVIGFSGMRDYPRLLEKLSDAMQSVTYSPSALGRAVGLSSGAADAAAAALGAATLVAVFLLARRNDGDRLALSAAIGASLALSPIVWDHYFLILLVPIALARPRLSTLWFVPIAVAFAFGPSDGSIVRISLALGTSALVLVLTARRVHFSFPEVRRASAMARKALRVRPASE